MNQVCIWAIKRKIGMTQRNKKRNTYTEVDRKISRIATGRRSAGTKSFNPMYVGTYMYGW